jgi:hypothetical protein
MTIIVMALVIIAAFHGNHDRRMTIAATDHPAAVLPLALVAGRLHRLQSPGSKRAAAGESRVVAGPRREISRSFSSCA